MPFLSHLQGFGWMLGGTPWDMVKGAWPAPSPPLGWPFKSCQMKSSGDCCFPSLSRSSILLSSPPQHPRLFSPPQLPTHSLLTLTLTHAQDPRSSSLPPLVVPINSGCGTPALRHSDPIRSGPSSPLRISCEWAGLPVRERVRKERRAIASLFRPPILSQRFKRTRMTSGAAATALVLEVPNTFFWNIPFHAKKGFLLSRPAPTLLRSASPGPDKGSFRASWSTTFNYLKAGAKVLMLYNADKVHLNAFLAKAEWRNQRRDWLIWLGIALDNGKGDSESKDSNRERDKENENWGKRTTLD